MAIPKKHAAIKCSTIRGKFTHFLNCRGTKNYTNNMQSSPPVKQCHHGYLHLFNLALNLLNLSMKPTTNILMINCYRILIKSCHTYLLSTLFWRENLCTICLEYPFFYKAIEKYRRELGNQVQVPRNFIQGDQKSCLGSK